MLKLNKKNKESLLIVELDGATFKFRQPSELDKLDMMLADKPSGRMKASFDMLQSVENIVDGDDKPIPVNQIVQYLSIEQITQIIIKLSALIKECQEAELKNEVALSSSAQSG